MMSINRRLFHIFLWIILVPGIEIDASSGNGGRGPLSLQQIPALPVYEQQIDKIIFRETPLRDVFHVLAEKYALNIFVDTGLNRKVTFQLKNVSLREVILFLVKETGVTFSVNAGVLKIYPDRRTPEISYARGLLSLRLKDEPLEVCVAEISRITNKSILIDKNVPETRVSGFLSRVRFEEGLRSLLRSNGLALMAENGIYTISHSTRHEETRSFLNRSVPGINTDQDSLITLDIRNTSLSGVLNQVAGMYDLNIVFKGSVSGEVSARMSDVTLDAFLAAILDGTEYTYKRSGRTLIIGRANQPYMRSQKLVKLDFLRAGKLRDVLNEGVFRDVQLIPVAENNALILLGSLPAVKEMEDYIRSLDQPTPQILIEILVVDINDSRLTELSLNSGLRGRASADSVRNGAQKLLPGLDLLLDTGHMTKLIDKAGHILGFDKIGKLPEDFFLAVRALEQKGVLKIHSRPQLATLNGCAADIAIGTTQYYKLTTKTPLRDPTQIYISETETFKTIEASIALEITPWVSSGNDITVEIHPEFNTPIGSFSPEIPPTLQSRSLNSIVRLKDGETIVLGGLVENSTDYSSEGIPYVSRIPLIGSLFKGQSRTVSKKELVIYVTPHIKRGTGSFHEIQ